MAPRCVFLNFNIPNSSDRTLGPNGHPRRRNRRYQGPFVRSGRGLLSPISRARRGGTEETRRVATKGMGGGLLLVGKATVCSLADEQTAAAERRMNEETVVFRRSVLLRVESCVFLKSLDRFLLVKLIGLSNKIYSAFMAIYFLLL